MAAGGAWGVGRNGQAQLLGESMLHCMAACFTCVAHDVHTTPTAFVANHSCSCLLPSPLFPQQQRPALNPLPLPLPNHDGPCP
jgi:hypothetical protein